jgi:anhydro-N-acetylmuramic acid kinase
VIVAGVMSGTSADGINVALVRITPSQVARDKQFNIKLVGHAEYPYPRAVRRTILGAMNATQASVAGLARLNFLLGELYAEAVLAAQRQFRVKAELIGCHGQTLYHQGETSSFLGRKLSATWQTGEGAVLAARAGVPAVTDFRPADMAAQGKGAPLVPFLDFLLYRHARLGRIAQNIGGIANLTAIPAASSADQVIAFDTGPGNMVIDAVSEHLFGKPFDRGGRIASFGSPLEPVLATLLRSAFFRRKPPKTAGREQFGREFVQHFLKQCGQADKHDIVATATALTARSIASAVQKFVMGPPRTTYRELVVSGGGAKNATLLALLAKEVNPLGIALRFSDDFGIPSDAKEAVAFALLAYQTWNRQPSSLPAATGARRSAILGKISYV